MNYCSCNQCNGIYPELEFPPEPQEVEEAETFKSVYDRLSDLVQDLIKYGASSEVFKELEAIIEEVDRIDDTLNEIQKEAGKLTGDELQYKIGEASQKLY